MKFSLPVSKVSVWTPKSPELSGGPVKKVKGRGHTFGPWKQQNLVQWGVFGVDRQPV